MLVSHDYKFIFIKPKKVAGTSIQAYLAQYCKNGIIYPHDPKSHMTASEVKQLVGEEVWNSYMKITVVRNPWDKTVSLYYWRGRKRPLYIHIWRKIIGMTWHSPAKLKSFKDYIKFLHGRGEVNVDKHITQIDGKLPDYEIIKFENMHEDLERICGKIGVTYKPEEMPQKKAGIRKTKSYADMYDEESKELVSQAYAEEIKNFGYEF